MTTAIIDSQSVKSAAKAGPNFRSSVLRWGLGPKERIEDAGEASHAGDEGGFVWASPLGQILVMLADAGIATRCVACHGEGVANAGSSPAMVRLPRIGPKSRLTGAAPTRAAIRRRSSRPGSGRSAIRVRAVTSPMPGPEIRRSEQPARRGSPARRHGCRDRVGRVGFKGLQIGPDRGLDARIARLTEPVSHHAGHRHHLSVGEPVRPRLGCRRRRAGGVLDGSRRPGRSSGPRAQRSWRAGRWRRRKHGSGVGWHGARKAPARAAATVIANPARGFSNDQGRGHSGPIVGALFQAVAGAPNGQGLT